MPTDFKTRGFTGGTHGGYNYQMGHWLLGVEADFEYLRSAGSNTVTGFVVPGLPATIATSLGTDWLFTLRPRLGLISRQLAILRNWWSGSYAAKRQLEFCLNRRG